MNVFMKKFLSLFLFILLAQVSSAQISKTIHVTSAGTLGTLLTPSEKSSITNLKISGNLDARDFKCLRDELTLLATLDISDVSINTYTGSEGTYSIGTGVSKSYPVNEIPQFSFYNANTNSGKNSIASISLPNSITSIGNSSFYMCNGLIEITIPNTVTNIELYAFQNCKGLTSVNLGTSVSRIGKQAFFECVNLKKVITQNPVPATLGGYAFLLSPLSIVFVPASSINVYKANPDWSQLPIGVDQILTINNPTAGGLRTALLAAGYKPFSSITKLNVTGNLNSTDIKLLKDSLSLLMELDISGSTIDGNVFPANSLQSRTNLFYVRLPESVVAIGNNAFESCTNLKITPLPSSLTSIGNYAYSTCKSLTGDLIIPNSVTYIGSYAFNNCVGLNGSIVLPASLTTLYSAAFSGCTGISGPLTIPESLTSIPSSAFYECGKLTQLNLGKNTSSIGDEAFYSCKGLTKISVKRSIPPTIFANTFNGVNKTTCTLEVPFGSKSAYQAADYWKQFTNIVEVSDTAKITIQVGTGGKVKDGNFVLPNDTVLKVLSGTVKTFTIVPDEGYEIDALTYKGADVKNNLIGGNQYTPAIDVDATIKVTFKRFYTINVKIGAGGTVKENNVALTDNQSIKLYSGDIRTFTILPGEGFEVDSITYGGQKLTLPLVNNQFTTPAAAKNDTLAVTFKATTLTYDITFDIGAGGGVKENNVIKVNGDVLTVPVNAVRTFTFEFDKGYQIDSLFYGGKNVTAQITNINEFVTPAIVANSTLKVTFKTVPYVIQIKDAASKGTINLFVNYGDTPSFNITPESSWKVNTVKFNDVDITPDINGIYKLPAVTADGLLVVSYVNLTASPVIGISNVKVYTNHSDIVIEGISANEPISVYTVNGARVYNLKSSGDRTVIPTRPNAVYLVKTAGMTYKVIL